MEVAFILKFLIISERKGLFFLLLESTHNPPKENNVKGFSVPLGRAIFLF